MDLQGLSKIGRSVTRGIVFFLFGIASRWRGNDYNVGTARLAGIAPRT